MEKKIRLNKFLANNGVCSRREADNLISSRNIKVNGKDVTVGYMVEPDDKVTVDGRQIVDNSSNAKYVYLMLNKPIGVITTMKEQFGRKCVKEYIPKKYGRVFPIGRLDMYTSGLLIFTNDGDLSNLLMHPSHVCEKEYEVKVNKKITDEFIHKICQGVVIDGVKTQPAQVIAKNSCEFNIIIREGRNRQIRKMCEACDYQVVQLNRIREGKLRLNNLKVGEIMKINREDII